MISTGAEFKPVSERDRYRVLVDIGRVLTATHSPVALYATVHEQCARLVEMAAFFISLYDADEDVATIAFRHGIPEDVPATYAGSDSRALRDGRPQVQRADSADSACAAVFEASDASASAVTAALLRDGRVIGEIAAFAPAGRVYGQDELETIFAVADLAAIAVSNVHHIEEIDRRRREAERLEEIGRALVASLELNEVLARVTSAAISLFDAGGATVWLLDSDGEEVRAAFTMGALAPRRGVTMPAPPELVRRMSSNESLILEEDEHAELLPVAMRSMSAAASTMAVPLLGEVRLIGALSIAHEAPRRYGPEDVRLLERLAIHAAIALSNARLHEQIRALSLTDPLTGLPNRRHLEMFLEREFAAAMRGRPLALLIFDLDNFKDYNDFAGHHAGDEALRAIGVLLASETRRMNLAARYGGDEFVAVLSGTDDEGALRHAHRITDAMARHPMLGPLGIRASIGIAAFEPGMSAPAELIAAADRDMYRRKANRDR